MPQTIHVLFVEDSHRDTQLMLGELRDGGYEPVSERVQTAEAVRLALASRRWDVVLSDYSMPRFTGMEALDILRETGLDIPFILVSGAIGEEMAARIMKAGAHDYILKSNLARLVPAIEREMKEAENRAKKRQAEEDLYRLNKELEQRVNERTAQLASANDTLKQMFERERLLRDILQDVSQTFNLDAIIKQTVQRVRGHFKTDRCAIFLYDQQSPETIRLAEQDVAENTVHLDPADVQHSAVKLLKDRVKTDPASCFFYVSDSEGMPDLLQWYRQKYSIRSVLAFEMRYQSVSYGTIVVHQCHTERKWSEAEIVLLGDVGTALGAAFHQANLYQHEQKSKQEAEEANRQKTKVLSFVSHDFKNPLASISRFVDILQNSKDGTLSSVQREIIGYIGEGVEQLRSMVMDILDKARLEQGRVTPVPSTIELQSFIEQLKPIFSAMTAQRNIEIHADIHPDLVVIYADPTHFRQIMTNLISNAVKYNRESGQVFLRFCKSEDGTSAVIEVQDTGEGIPPEKISQLFEEYYRAMDMTQAHQVEGTGLGLAFVKKLIELHDGSITVESELGIGSVFRIILPLAPSDTEAPEEAIVRDEVSPGLRE